MSLPIIPFVHYRLPFPTCWSRFPALSWVGLTVALSDCTFGIGKFVFQRCHFCCPPFHGLVGWLAQWNRNVNCFPKMGVFRFVAVFIVVSAFSPNSGGIRRPRIWFFNAFQFDKRMRPLGMSIGRLVKRVVMILVWFENPPESGSRYQFWTIMKQCPCSMWVSWLVSGCFCEGSGCIFLVWFSVYICAVKCTQPVCWRVFCCSLCCCISWGLRLGMSVKNSGGSWSPLLVLCYTVIDGFFGTGFFLLRL